MFHQLPAEIALQAISYLPLHTLYSVNLVSRDWNALITINEPAVYRNAAILHHFIDKEPVSAGSLPIDWKAYCRRELEIERGWHGKAPSTTRELTATGTTVHRIKVDYEFGFVITTCQTGGLFVCDIKTNCILWGLPSSHVVRYAHLEYDRGYIVFNRYDNCKEIWRHTVDANGDQHPEAFPPDQKMLDASILAAESYGSTENSWGHFKAWALLRVPENSCAFRFSYPTLLAASANNAYLWDITRLQLILVVRDIQRQHHGLVLASINYVEVNDMYVFICGTASLRIFARQGGELLYQLSTRELSSATWDVLPQSPGLASSVVHPQMLLHNHHSSNPFHGEFMACHVSASGNDLAALTTNGKLVVLPDFRRLFTGSNAIHHRDIAIILNFQPFSSVGNVSCYLAVGGRNGKLAIATRKGIYVVSLDFDFTRLTADRPPEPGVSVCRLSKFENDLWLLNISCLQITHDAVYFTYKASPPASSDTARNAPVPGVGFIHPHGFAGYHGNLMDILDDLPADEWVDEEPEDADVETDEDEDDPVHAIVHNLFLPTATNTVHCVTL